MKVSVDNRSLGRRSFDWVAILLFEGRGQAAPRLSDAATELDQQLGGCLRAALESGGFRGRKGEALPIFPAGAGRRKTVARRILLVGGGSASKIGAEALREAAGLAVRSTTSRGAKRIALLTPGLRRGKREQFAQAIAEGLVLGGYRFDGHRGTDPNAPSSLRSVNLVIPAGEPLREIRSAVAAGVVIAESQNVARDLSNEPANTLPPAALARGAQRVARQTGLRCQVMGVPQLTTLKMGGILAVGGGSSRPPRLIVMEYNRPPKNASGRARRPTVCLIGKGITFDSGGISIKPSAAMDEMKHDMSGAAAVVGAMRACALLKLRLHVVGVIAAAENLPSSTAYRPGDVITTYSGKTVEILNTDAEGRVVLADALHFANARFAPDAMVDLATLTGACQIALGPWASGLFANDENLAEEIRAAGEQSSEIAWPMPLLKEHRQAMKSQIADLKNTGGRGGSASTAAGFLQEFVGDTPWVHLDIAGTAWGAKASPTQAPGATGVGVRMLAAWLRERSG
jgi:leucyl aminopeptidase